MVFLHLLPWTEEEEEKEEREDNDENENDKDEGAYRRTMKAKRRVRKRRRREIRRRKTWRRKRLILLISPMTSEHQNFLSFFFPCPLSPKIPR